MCSTSRRFGQLLIAIQLLACKPAQTPATDKPEPNPTPGARALSLPPAPRDPFVLLTRVGDVFAPLVCWDGQAFLSSDASECLELVPVGTSVSASDGSGVALEAVTDITCGRSDSNTFPARPSSAPPSDAATYATWPPSLAPSVARVDGTASPSEVELAAIVEAFAVETQGVFEVEPKLYITSGLELDVDGDVLPDRVFTSFEDGRLYGGVFVFLATNPSEVASRSVMQFDRPLLIGATQLDGQDGHELWIEAEFVEGLESGVVTSAMSERIVAVRPEGPVEISSWGCRMF